MSLCQCCVNLFFGFLDILRYCCRYICCWCFRSRHPGGFDEKVTVVWFADEMYSRCVKQFFDRIRLCLGGKKNRFHFVKSSGLNKSEYTTAVIVVPLITRTGIDVDHALDQVKLQIPENVPLVVLVLHRQAHHIDDVVLSRHQLTDMKYSKLCPILDLQVFDGQMRETESNTKMAKELSHALIKQRATKSLERPLLR